MRGGTDFEEAEGRETGGAPHHPASVGCELELSGFQRGNRPTGQGRTAGAAPNLSAGRYLPGCQRRVSKGPGETGQQQRRIEERFQFAFIIIFAPGFSPCQSLLSVTASENCDPSLTKNLQCL